MALRHALGTALDLPFPVTSVYHEEFVEDIVNLTLEDKHLAMDYVINTMADEKRMVETLVSLPVWNQYVVRICDVEKTAIDGYFDELMDQFEDENMQNPKMEQDYVNGLNDLKHGWEHAIDELLKNKTHELCFPVSPDKL